MNTNLRSPIGALIALISVVNQCQAAGSEATSHLPLVFDPGTKKYFIGGNSKFLLKPGEQSSLIDRIEVSVDGGDYRSYGSAVDFHDEGKHTLKFRAINPVNNWSPVQFVEVFVDLSAPVTEAKLKEDKSYRSEKDNLTYVALNSSVTLSSQDNLSGVASIEYSWDGTNFSPYSKPIAVEKAGRQTLFFRSIDRVGNVEQSKKIEYVVDATAPTSELQIAGGKPTVINGKTYVSDAVSFAVTSNDDLSSVKQTWVSIDGKEQLYIKPIYLLQEGTHSISYYSIDNVGNREERKNLSFYTVSTPPRTQVYGMGRSVNTGGINFANREFRLKLEAKDNVVGLDRIEVRVDQDSDYRPYLEPLHFTNTGLHTVSYRAVDRVGNIEPAKTYSVNIVEGMPETTLATAQPIINREGIAYSPAPNVITLNVANGTGVGIRDTMVSINGGAFQSYQGPITIQPENRTYKISYKSIDKLGNEEQLKTATFHMMRSVPIVDLFVTNGQSAEEKVRTNYLEQSANVIAGTEDKKERRRKHGEPSRSLASPSHSSAE